MFGIYNGAQSKSDEKMGRKILYIPSLGHKSNLWGLGHYGDVRFDDKSNLCVELSCEASLVMDEFFIILPDLYNYHTKSTMKFGKFKENVGSMNDALMVKNSLKLDGLGVQNP